MPKHARVLSVPGNGGSSIVAHGDHSMAKRRKAIRLQPDEDKLLRYLYLRRRIPSDQYEYRPNELALFIAGWNRLSGRSDSPGEVLHYIKTQRKNGTWVTFDGNHKRQPGMDLPELLPEHWAAFDDVYRSIAVPTDHFIYDPELPRRFSVMFKGQTGLTFAENDVKIMLLERRKEGLLPRLAGDTGPDDGGFRDLDDVVGNDPG
jgi:hypothetical protein